MERVLLSYQINREMSLLLYPIDREMVFRQAAWMAQIEWGDHDDVEVCMCGGRGGKRDGEVNFDQ